MSQPEVTVITTQPQLNHETMSHTQDYPLPIPSTLQDSTTIAPTSLSPDLPVLNKSNMMPTDTDDITTYQEDNDSLFLPMDHENRQVHLPVKMGLAEEEADAAQGKQEQDSGYMNGVLKGLGGDVGETKMVMLDEGQ